MPIDNVQMKLAEHFLNVKPGIIVSTFVFAIFKILLIVIFKILIISLVPFF